MSKSKKIFIFVLIFLILFVNLISSVFAADYDYLIIDNTKDRRCSPSFEEAKDSAENSEYILSGDYYYFNTYSSEYKKMYSFVVEKSLCDLSEFRLEYAYSYNGMHSFIIYISSNNIVSDCIKLSDAYISYNEGQGTFFLIEGFLENNVYSFPFATNLDKNIVVSDGNDYFYNKPFTNPYIANTAEDLATGTFDYFLIMPRFFVK